MDKSAAGTIAECLASHALSLTQRGEWVAVSRVATRMRHWTDGRFRVAHRTPFNRIEDAAPYAIDIWDGAKVLRCEWSNYLDLRVRTWRRGNWEAAFLAAR